MKCFLYLTVVTSPLALAQSLCTQYGYYTADNYEFNNNEWGETSGSGSGCLYIDSVSTSGTAFHVDWSWSGGNGQVKAYPYAGLDITNQQLINNIGSMPTTADWSYTGSGINADISYDLFSASDPNHVTSSGDYELMIWLGKEGSIQPIGSTIATATVGGLSWDLWYGSNGAQQTYSFVRAGSDIQSWNGDIMNFWNYLTENENFPASTQYLITTQFGTEAFDGSDCTFTVTDWSAAINVGGGGGGGSSSSSSSTPPPPVTSTAPPTGGATQTQWGQCGGSGYTGPTACAVPYACQTSNLWYAQCL